MLQKLQKNISTDGEVMLKIKTAYFFMGHGVQCTLHSEDPDYGNVWCLLPTDLGVSLSFYCSGCVGFVINRSRVRLPALHCQVKTWMGDRLSLCANKQSRYVTGHLGQFSLPSLRGIGKSSTGLWLGLRQVCSLVSDGRQYCVMPYGKCYAVALRWSFVKSAIVLNLTYLTSEFSRRPTIPTRVLQQKTRLQLLTYAV